MRIFISEFVCGGGWPEAEIGGSLAREGRAMLSAVVDDFSRVPGVRVTTTWDARLGGPPFANAHVIAVDSADDEPAILRELAQLCDATLLIAPETGAVLADRCRLVEGAGGRLLGPTSRAVELCTSKSRLGTVLQSRGVGTIDTAPIDWNRLEHGDHDGASGSANSSLGFPLVIKPDDGAGSQSTWLIPNRDSLRQLLAELKSDPSLRQAIMQPFVPGRAVSVGLIFSERGAVLDVLPPAEQTLSGDGRFHYLGGVVPARGVDPAAIQQTARAACETVTGLHGYVGVDLIVPDADPARPLVVEINPRLTTSYIGYRQLTADNLAGRMLPGFAAAPITWRNDSITFDVLGAQKDSGGIPRAS